MHGEGTHRQPIFLIGELDSDDCIELVLVSSGDTVGWLLLRRTDDQSGRRHEDSPNHDEMLLLGRCKVLEIVCFTYIAVNIQLRDLSAQVYSRRMTAAGFLIRSSL